MRRLAIFVFAVTAVPIAIRAQPLNVPWSGYGHDPQHTAVSATGAQSLSSAHWSTPVDLNPQYSGGDLLIHYGSPIVTAANTVLVPVKTGATDGFQISAFHNGSPYYTLTTDYSLPPHNWTPSYGPVLSLRNRIYYPGAGGTILYRDQVDSATGPTGRIAFFGNTLYANNTAAFNSTVMISTPLTTDRYGDIYFGFIVTGENPANLVSGVARVSLTGAGTWVSAVALSGGDVNIALAAMNCAPALSNDQRTVYIAVTNGGYGFGYLTSMNSTTLTPVAHVLLNDPRGGVATVAIDSSASPMVGPDGDVYYGVLENNCCVSHNDRGWMLHFDSTLGVSKIPGSFGWDDTASVVASNLVPSYQGSSPYLILTKYNNYKGLGTGDGVNKIAILDPRVSQLDEYSVASVNVMKEVITVTGVTPDGPDLTYPNAVREWCINDAVIDPFTKSAYVNSEDGTMYRWDFTTNTLSQSFNFNAGVGEAYTPTIIGVDGTVYAINNAVLYALGN